MFSDLADRNIFYERIDRKLSVGEKRNLLIDKSHGEIIVQFDDDDYYCPDYVRTMVSALSTLNADLINLRGWFLYDCRSRFFGYWNLMQKEGLHYRCDQAGVVQLMLNSENNGGLADNHLGYGFSYAFKKKVWKEVKFPEIDWSPYLATFRRKKPFWTTVQRIWARGPAGRSPSARCEVSGIGIIGWAAWP
jgi:glycosyltransferase involved in cell wall biosynthesis